MPLNGKRVGLPGAVSAAGAADAVRASGTRNTKARAKTSKLFMGPPILVNLSNLPFNDTNVASMGLPELTYLAKVFRVRVLLVINADLMDFSVWRRC